MLNKEAIESRLNEAKQRLSKISESLNQAEVAVKQLTEQKLITIGQIESLSFILRDDPETPKPETKTMNGAAKEETT